MFSNELEPLPPLPMTQPPFGSGLIMPPRGSPMKFTTFHQHQNQQTIHQPAPINGNNNGGNFNGSNFQTIQITQQQMYLKQPHHHHQQQQFYENNPHVNYVSNSSYSKMSAPLVTQLQQQQQQRSTAIWHQQYTSTSPIKDFNGSSNDSG